MTKIKLAFITASALAGVGFNTGTASAMPFGSAPNNGEFLQDVRLVCDQYGRHCQRRGYRAYGHAQTRQYDPGYTTYAPVYNYGSAYPYGDGPGYGYGAPGIGFGGPGYGYGAQGIGFGPFGVGRW
jgi:hypothetical protein